MPLPPLSEHNSPHHDSEQAPARAPEHMPRSVQGRSIHTEDLLSNQFVSEEVRILLLVVAQVFH